MNGHGAIGRGCKTPKPPPPQTYSGHKRLPGAYVPVAAAWRGGFGLSALSGGDAGVLILLMMIAIGARSGDLYAGILRGLLDAAICLAGFAALGRYLGLRRSGAGR